MAKKDEEVPFMQQVLDSPFLLLVLGIATLTFIYHVWGVIDILTIPLAK
jgi:hypothetical protein